MPRSRSIDEFLSSYPEPVRETARAARTLLAGILPDAKELIDESAKVIGYSYGPGYKGLVFTLILSRTGVKLGVAHGADLPDPTHLMAGSGKVHRYVQLNHASDLKRTGLTRLLRNALRAWQRRTAADR